MKIIDEARMPRTGAEFVAMLHRATLEPVPLKVRPAKAGGYPKICLAPFALVGGMSNLVNIWAFEDEDANGVIVGGIEGPSADPAADYATFEMNLKSLGDPERYRRALEILDDAIYSYATEKPDRFGL